MRGVRHEQDRENQQQMKGADHEAIIGTGAEPPNKKTLACAGEHCSNAPMLTDRQHQLVGFLRSYQRQHGVMPSTRDIQQHFGFASQTAAMSHLKALERKGAIRRLAGKARAVVFPEDMERDTVDVPVFGLIPAGFAADNPELSDGKVTLSLGSLGLSRSS